jgi:hypothetical protein
MMDMMPKKFECLRLEPLSVRFVDQDRLVLIRVYLRSSAAKSFDALGCGDPT